MSSENSPGGLKEEAKNFGRGFLADVALEFYRGDILNVLSEFLEPYSTSDVVNHIQQGELLPPPQELLSLLKGYRSFVEQYSVEDVGRLLLDWFQEIRPDIAKILISSDNIGAEWLAAEAELIRNSILHPELISQSQGQSPKNSKEVFSKATCSNCKGTFLVPKDKVDAIKICPYCGEKHEAAREPKSKLSKEPSKRKRQKDTEGGSTTDGKEAKEQTGS